MFLIIFIFFERTAAPPLEPEGVAVLRLIGLRGKKKIVLYFKEGYDSSVISRRTEWVIIIGSLESIGNSTV